MKGFFYKTEILFNPVILSKKLFPIFMKALLSLLLFFPILSQAQPFQFRADVATVTQSGYHRIVLPPAVVGRLNNTLGDVRLYDNQGREVPYLLNRANGGQVTRFVSYPVSRTNVPGKATSLVIQPKDRQPIRSLTLLVKNARIRKPAQLSGSNNGQQWFGIAGDFVIDPPQNTNTTSGATQLDFPLSDYAFYRLDLPDSLSAPLNILQVGHYETGSSTAIYTPISNPTIHQTEIKATAQTDVRLAFSEPARIDKLVIQVGQPAQYQRRAEVGFLRERKTRRYRTERFFEVIRAFTLSSSDNNVVLLPGVQTTELHLLIDNEDNTPLTIGSVQAYQLTTHLTANLTANTPYNLLFSAANVLAPSYDLSRFQASIPANAPEISVNKIGPVGMDGAAENSFWSSRWLIWAALGLGLAVLGLLSFRMVREMK